jgi:Zn-dependent M28 family amino/carboxypeptidase
VLSGTRKPGIAYNVHAVLPGQSEENIIVSSHLDSGFKGTIEDASGISSVLAQAYIWAKVSIEHRPKTLVFVGAGSHYYPRPLGATRFVQDHKDDLMKNNLLVINVEHFASKE